MTTTRWPRIASLLLLLLVLPAAGCDGDEDATGPRPSERFDGVWSLRSVAGEALPHEVVTPSATFVRHALTLDVSDEKHLPEAQWTDSLLQTMEGPEGDPVVTNHSEHGTLTGFVNADTVTFRELFAQQTVVFRFVIDEEGVPVRLDPEGEPLNEEWEWMER